jgi:hypothetical protein
MVVYMAITGCCINTQNNPVIENTSKLWNVEIKQAKAATSLSAYKSSLQYGGTVIEIPFEQLPKDGYLFLLLNMTVEKIDSGKSTFSWKGAYIIDSDGNKYARHENDTFLDALKFKRLKATDIVLGLNEGYVCYEIPIKTAKNNLWFIYESDDDYIKIKLNIENKKEIK